VAVRGGSMVLDARWRFKNGSEIANERGIFHKHRI